MQKRNVVEMLYNVCAINVWKDLFFAFLVLITFSLNFRENIIKDTNHTITNTAILRYLWNCVVTALNTGKITTESKTSGEWPVQIRNI